MITQKLNCKPCMAGRCQDCKTEDCLCRETHENQTSEIRQQANVVASEMAKNLKDDLDLKKSFRKIDALCELKEICELTIKNDTDLVYQIIFNGLSAHTPNPSHLMILERTSEGKTYPALQVAQYFPKETVIVLASATPQSFKYEHGIRVDQNYESLEEKIADLEEQRDSCNDRQERDSIDKRKKSLLRDHKTLIDLRGKWIIFKEPPDAKLLEMLYSTLSKDEEYSEHKLVNQNNPGKNQSFTVVLRGTPSMLICSARDETKSQRWMETFSRFNIVSPKSSKAKYRAGMDLIGKKLGLPKEIYEEHVLSDIQKDRAKKITSFLIDSLGESKGEIFNPFMDKLSKEFPQDAGYRWRQRQRFDSLVIMNTLCNAARRPAVIINNRKIPIVTLEDIAFANNITTDTDVLPPHKTTWYRNIFLNAWQEKGEYVDELSISKKVLTGSAIKEYIEDKTQGKTSVKAIREIFLESLYEHGYVDKTKDPRNKTRDVYWPVNENEREKSSFIVISSFDESCVRLCLGKYMKQRFEYEYRNEKIKEEELVKIVIKAPPIMPENNNDETASDGDLTIFFSEDKKS